MQNKIYKDLSATKTEIIKENKKIYWFPKKIIHRMIRKKKQKVQINQKLELKKEARTIGRYPLKYKLRCQNKIRRLKKA